MYTAAFMGCFHESSYVLFRRSRAGDRLGFNLHRSRESYQQVPFARNISLSSSSPLFLCLYPSLFVLRCSLARAAFSDTSELVNDIFSPDWLGTTSARHFINSLTDKFQFQWRFSTARKSPCAAPRAICHLSLWKWSGNARSRNADKKFRRVNIFLPYLPAIRYRTMLLMSV